MSESADASPSKQRSNATRNALRSFKVLAVFALAYYVVVPQLADARKAAETLSDVKVEFLLMGLALQGCALFCYSLLTRSALPHNGIPRLGTLFRIQLSTRAISSVVPGGAAASNALGFRLLTKAGVSGPDAGFALGAAGLGSAVVLNLILWLALLVSIPLSGVKPVYVTVALVGVFILLVFFGLVFALLRGQVRAQRVARRIAARVTFMDEDRAAHTVQHLADRLRQLLSRPDLLRQLLVWGVLNWMLDAASLGVFLFAFGGRIRVDSLIVSFCIVNVLAVVPITPGGLGVVEFMYPSLLVTIFGMGVIDVTYGVGAYRIAQLWLPIAIGGACYLTLRVGPWRIDRHGERLRGLRDEVRNETRNEALVEARVEARVDSGSSIASPVLHDGGSSALHGQ
jgi:putative heme transporter